MTCGRVLRLTHTLSQPLHAPTLAPPTLIDAKRFHPPHQGPSNGPPSRRHNEIDYLAKHSVSVLRHPPYSPDIAPCDFFFFPKLKMTLKGRRFSSSSEVIENTTMELNMLKKIDFELAFQQFFSSWKKMCR
ncbi:hypothetical protein LAZ67_20002638 [Cordylochernes scorpioides]|uniref:Histone-lysine N-methyltransferase SETMAR n=1 Tax=Cordylochernes scorpioides TaxID=51811 RepID=A0ABY6LKZ6_9ARAC|nr:hypothetical protein LAZ67_20002638 [Cordylochernes scorpioides]